jgi:hypothetical protein
MSYLSRKFHSLAPFLRKKKEKQGGGDKEEEEASHKHESRNEEEKHKEPHSTAKEVDSRHEKCIETTSRPDSATIKPPQASSSEGWNSDSCLPPIIVPSHIETPINTNPGGLSLRDFDMIRTLGTGSFGRVHLVKYRQSPSTFYAMKVMKKSKIVELRQVEHTMNERNILARIKHPFIVDLFCTFQDAHHIYFILDFVVGGEIFSILRRAKVRHLTLTVLSILWKLFFIKSHSYILFTYA